MAGTGSAGWPCRLASRRGEGQHPIAVNRFVAASGPPTYHGRYGRLTAHQAAAPPVGVQGVYKRLTIMLQAIRGQVGSWIVKILFVFLILSFAVWGVGDILRTGGPSDVAAEVGGVEVPLVEVDRAFTRQVEQLRRVLGPEFDAAAAARLGVLDQTVEQIVAGTLFDLSAADLGIDPPTEMIADVIRNERAFSDPATGRFSRDVFLAVLAANGLSEAEFVQSVRREFGRETVAGALTAGVEAPAALTERLAEHRRETRIADTVTIAADAVTGIPAPGDEALAAFHQSHPDRFTAPEYRVLTVVALTADDLAGEVAVDEQALLDEYHARDGRYRRDEPLRRFDQVVLPRDRQDMAHRVADAARGGLSLQEAVAAAGADAGVIPLDWTTEEEMLPALAEPAFALAPGGVSDPIESPFGWHVLAVTEVAGDGVLPFEAVRDEIEAAVRRERALDSLFEYSNRLDDALAGGASLEDAAASLGLPVIATPPVSRDGEVRGAAALPDLPATDQVIDAAWTIEEGDVSRLIETRDRDAYFVVRVDRVLPPALRPLAEVRDEVAAAWEQQQRAEAAAALAETAARRLREGAGPEAIAAETDAAEAGRTPALLRDGSNAGDLPPRLVTNLFDIVPGEVTVAETPAGAVVARLVEVVPADPDADALAAIRTDAVEGLRSDIVAQFANALRQRYEVEVNEAALQRLRGIE